MRSDGGGRRAETKTEAFDFIRRIRGRDGSRKVARNSTVVARATDSPPPRGIRGFRCAPAHPGEEDEHGTTNATEKRARREPLSSGPRSSMR
jgi:hypothetical protein